MSAESYNEVPRLKTEGNEAIQRLDKSFENLAQIARTVLAERDEALDALEALMSTTKVPTESSDGRVMLAMSPEERRASMAAYDVLRKHGKGRMP